MMTFFYKVFGIGRARQRGPARHVRPALEALDDRNLCSAVGTSVVDPVFLPVKSEPASLIGLATHNYHVIYGGTLPPLGLSSPS